MRYRVLVADDEEFERRALKLILGREGMPEIEVIEAKNGIEAAELAGTGRLDAAFLDIQMPGGDGLAVAERLREIIPTLPIIFLTAHDRFDYARKALRIGVEDFLLKPASAEEVEAAFRAAVDPKRGAAGQRGEDQGRIEGAVTWLADEYRGALGLGRVPEGGFERFCAMRASGPFAVEALALRGDRPSADALGERSRSRSVAAFVERLFASQGLVALAAPCNDGVLCMVGRAGGAGPGGGEDEEGEGARLRETAGRLLAGLDGEFGPGFRIGAAFFSGAAPAGGRNGGGHRDADLLRAARRASIFAGPGKPLLILPVATSQAAGLQAAVDGGAASRGAGRALDLMDERHAEDLSLELVAGELRLSPSHLSRLIVREFGLGFADCLSRLRVERARLLLAEGELSVKEVAAIVGFHDPAYFARVWRRFTGTSPGEYRSKILEAE